MKTDKNNMDLQELLASLEHAGRNERRQQELGDMIDRLAAAEGRKQHGFWWWGGRVAAAACILFFITTAIRIWYIPTESAAPLRAQAVEPQVDTPTDDTLPAVAESVALHKAPRRPVAHTRNPQPLVAESSIQQVSEPDDVEPQCPDSAMPQEPVVFYPDELLAQAQEPLVYDEPDSVPPPLVADAATPLVNDPDVSTSPSNVSSTPQKRKPGILGTILQRYHPSRMEGEVLAVCLL